MVVLLTLQVSRLLLAEHCAHFTDSSGQGDLQVLCHDFFALIDGALLLRFTHHHLYPLNRLLTSLEAPCDVLCKLLDLALLPLLHVFVVEAWEHVLLVQLVELARLFRDVCEIVRDLVLYIEPAWRQQVHLDDCIAVIFVGTTRHEPLPLLRHASAVAEAIGAGSAIARLLLGVVRIGLAVGYKAIQATSATSRRVHSCAAYRLVRSRHMVGRRASMALCHGSRKLQKVCRTHERAGTWVLVLVAATVGAAPWQEHLGPWPLCTFPPLPFWAA